MAVDWGLANSGQYDYLQSLQGLGNAALQQQSLKQQQYNFNQTQRQDQARPQVIAAARGGDFKSAQDQAFTNNDLDALKFVGGLQEEQRAQVGRHADMIASVAANLSRLPAEQRKAALASAAPGLLAQGFTPQELAQADVSDAGLTGYISAASTTKDALDTYYKSQQPITVADGAEVFGAPPMGGGQRPVIASNPKDAPKPDYIWDPTGNRWLLKPGTGGAGYPGAGQMAAPGATPQSGIARQGGYTPRSSENSGAAIDGKYGVIKRVAGIDPDAPLAPGDIPNLARGIIASEGRAAARNNVGNIEDGAFARSQPGYAGKSGRWATFDTPEAGASAVAALLQRKLSSGFVTTRDIIEGKPVGGQNAAPQTQSGLPGVISMGPPRNAEYRILSPQEATQRGLDPKSKWQVGPSNQVTALPAKGDKPLTEIQAKSSGFLSTMVEAQRSLAQVRGYTPNNVSIALDTLSNGNPVREGLSQTDRRVLNAQQAFAGAALRLESGAVINDQEIARKARALFPLPGDGPEVQADKRHQREAALRAMRIAAGPGSDNIPYLGDTSKTVQPQGQGRPTVSNW